MNNFNRESASTPDDSPNQGEIAASQTSNEWAKVENAEFRGEKKEAVGKIESAEDVKELLSKYTMREGEIVDRETGLPEKSQDIVNNVMVAKLMYDEGKSIKANKERWNGGRNKVELGASIESAMRKWGVIDDGDDRWYPKQLYKRLVEDGVAEDSTISDLESAKKEDRWQMFNGEMRPYGMAVLEYMLRQKGEKLDGFRAAYGEETKNGVAKAKFEIRTVPRDEVESSGVESGKKDGENELHHPAAKELKLLEWQMKKAEERGDETGANYFREAMKSVVRKNPMPELRPNVPEEEWAKMSPEDRQQELGKMMDAMAPAEKARYATIKMKEAKLLGDDDAVKFWRANRERWAEE